MEQYYSHVAKIMKFETYHKKGFLVFYMSNVPNI